MRPSQAFAAAGAVALTLALMTGTPEHGWGSSVSAPPATLDAFQQEAARVLEAHGIPGAGIALVRESGIEWAGGIGRADLELGTPARADTHFLAGSVEKSLIAMGLVQLSEDALLDLEAPLSEVAPEIGFTNPWAAAEPVRIIHLLEHTAGWDDFPFGAMYGERAGGASLTDALARSAGSRHSRWQPGTRMSYSNPGYAVAAYVLEKISLQPFDQYLMDHVMRPIGMTSATFARIDEAGHGVARGYSGPAGSPVPWSGTNGTPAGALQVSAAELGLFVQMLLGWGELDEAFIVDPEYLSNMEHPRTGLAVEAGLRLGHGAGIAWWVDQPYLLLGYGGSLDGFTGAYGYSPARDAGVVVLTNRQHAHQAVEQIMALGMKYLKRGIAPAVRPAVGVDPPILAEYEGYYHDAAPRIGRLAFLTWLAAGRSVTVRGDGLRLVPVLGAPANLVPVAERLFRTETQIDATHVFTTDAAGRMVLTGVTTHGGIYAERVPRWRVELARVPVLASLTLIATIPVMSLVWGVAGALRPRGRGFWGLKAAILAVPLVLTVPLLASQSLDPHRWDELNVWTGATFLATLALPALAAGIVALTWGASRAGGGAWLLGYTAAIGAASGIVSLYLGSWSLIGFRSWMS